MVGLLSMHYLEDHSCQWKIFSPEEINVLTIIESLKMAPLPQYPLINIATLNQRKVLRMSLMTSEDNKS